MNKTHLARTVSFVTALLLPAALAGSVSGTVVDDKGNPVANALVWIQPALSGTFGGTSSLVEVRTDAKGRYRADALLTMPYYVKAWRTLRFEGQSYCHRLGMTSVSDYASFVPKGNVVRNFKARFSGLIGDDKSNDGAFGGEVRAMHSIDDESGILRAEKYIVTFQPLALASKGPLKSFTRSFSTNVLMEDIPIGRYKVTMIAVMPDGKKRAVKVGLDGETYAASTVLTFEPSGKCDNGHGLERAFLYYRGD